MSKSLSPSISETSQPYRIARVFDPDSFTIVWDVFLETDNGYVQVSRFDGVLDYHQGAIGDGEYFSWEFVPESSDTTMAQNPDGMVYLEQKYGAKRKHQLKTAASKVDGQWYVPVLKRDGKDILVQPDNVALPRTTLRDDVDAIHDSNVEENRIVFDSVFGPINLGYYDGLVSHQTGEMLPLEYDAYITDSYDIEIKLSTKTPGLVETYRPSELLYLLETGQISLYLNQNGPQNVRTHLLADGRETLEPANALSW